MNLKGTVKNLKPQDISKRKDFLELSAKGGATKSWKKDKSARLRSLLMRSDDKIDEKALQMVFDEEFSAYEIQKIISNYLERDLPIKWKMQLLDKMTKVHATLHGVKTKNTNVNVNIDFNERLKEWRKELEIAKDVTISDNRVDGR